jgi:hypothetical protein
MPRDEMGQTVFLGYDQAALDREYNNSGKVANAAEYLARYPAESARARETLPVRLDLRYGPRAGETLDVFLPEGHGPWPVHVFVHGGYWRSLDKQDFSFAARGLQPAGVLVAVINYALVPTVDMDELVRQVRASVAWLHRNAAALGGDPARLTVSGHSAGGHLVAMLMATDWDRFAALPPDVVKAGSTTSSRSGSRTSMRRSGSRRRPRAGTVRSTSSPPPGAGSCWRSAPRKATSTIARPTRSPRRGGGAGSPSRSWTWPATTTSPSSRSSRIT